jgi:hypothetical protein
MHRIIAQAPWAVQLGWRVSLIGAWIDSLTGCLL